MIETDARVTLKGVLNSIPVAVAMFVGEAKEHYVGFPRKILAFLNWIK